MPSRNHKAWVAFTRTIALILKTKRGRNSPKGAHIARQNYGLYWAISQALAIKAKAKRGTIITGGLSEDVNLVRQITSIFQQMINQICLILKYKKWEQIKWEKLKTQRHLTMVYNSTIIVYNSTNNIYQVRLVFSARIIP